MATINKGNINFLTNGEDHDADAYNRPVDDLADEIQLGFDEIDAEIVSSNTRIDDGFDAIDTLIAAELDAINGEVI